MEKYSILEVGARERCGARGSGWCLVVVGMRYSNTSNYMHCSSGPRGARNSGLIDEVYHALWAGAAARRRCVAAACAASERDVSENMRKHKRKHTLSVCLSVSVWVGGCGWRLDG